MKILKLLKRIPPFNPGEVAGFPDKQAYAMLIAGEAEMHDAEAADSATDPAQLEAKRQASEQLAAEGAQMYAAAVQAAAGAPSFPGPLGKDEPAAPRTRSKKVAEVPLAPAAGAADAASTPPAPAEPVAPEVPPTEPAATDAPEVVPADPAAAAGA